MNIGDLVKIVPNKPRHYYSSQHQAGSELEIVGILVSFEKKEKDGGWVIMTGSSLETYISTWWSCEVIS